MAFDAASHWYPLVFQHLLVGMNAHINLDLGIATATCAPGDQVNGLQADFDRINDVLAEQVAAVEQEMAEISPWVAMLNTFGLRTETSIINFNMTKARDCAWNEACNLAATPAARMQAAIADLDSRVAPFGRLLISPPLLVKLHLLPIRLREVRGVRRVLDILVAEPKPFSQHATAGGRAS